LSIDIKIFLYSFVCPFVCDLSKTLSADKILSKSCLSLVYDMSIDKESCLSFVYRQVDKFLSIDKRRLVVAIVFIAISHTSIQSLFSNFVFNIEKILSAIYR